MRIQLIQQKVPIGSQVTFTLKTGEKMSGSLAELGTDYVTLDVPNGQEILDVEEIKGIHLGNHVDDSDNSDATATPIITSEDSDAIPLPTVANPQLDDNQILTTSDGSESVVEQESPDVAIVSPDDSESSERTSDPVEETENLNVVDIETDSVDFEEQVSQQLDEIEKRYSNIIEGTKIELELPDFTFPAEELTGWQNTGVAGKWLQIKNKYENAQRINELSTKFDRIQPLLMEVKSLVRRFPNSSSLKRVTAYFYAVSDDWQEAIQIYKEVAITSEDFNDWFNVAVSALNLNEEELACYSLEKFFNDVSVIEKPNAWNIYVNLVEKFNNIPPFRELCKKDENVVAKGEIEVLFDAAIYLFKKKGTTELAMEIVQKHIKGKSSKCLLIEVCQKLGGQSTVSYRQFLSDFMNERIQSEKESDPILSDHLESNATTKKFVVPNLSQKQDLKAFDSDLYASAKRADSIEKDLEKAERLYRDCIGRNIRYESAIKDLAMVLVRLSRAEEAVELLENNRGKLNDKQALDNVLITVYPAASQYKKAIDLLNNALKQAQDQERRLQIRMQLANAYIKLEDYLSAEKQFEFVQKLRPQNITVQRNLAFCFSKQNRYDEAKRILNKIQSTSSDAKTTELMEAIERAERTGEFTLDEETIIEVETVLSYLSGELSDFAQFFLGRCEFDGVSPDRINEGKYTGSEKDFQFDISRLEDVARQLGTRRPRDRSHYYLSAARIYYDLGGNQNLFYRYLCRSFTSRGDDAVSENKHLDTVREWYCEALNAYDGGMIRHKSNEQDAVNSLVRYLYSTLGHAHINLTPNKIPSVDKALSDVITNHPDKKKVFDSIANLVLHSRFAADRLLNRLYDNEGLRTMAVKYLKEMDINVPDEMERLVDFVRPWDELRNEKSNAARNTSDELRLLNNFELTTSWLEDNIRFIEDCRSSLLFELNQQRIAELQRILKTALELCKQVTFEEQERLCNLLDKYCQDLLKEIEEGPTKLSVEVMYPIIETIQGKVITYLAKLNETSKPELKLRLPVESHFPDTDRQITVQIVLENERGRSPAESLGSVYIFCIVMSIDAKWTKPRYRTASLS